MTAIVKDSLQIRLWALSFFSSCPAIREMTSLKSFFILDILDCFVVGIGLALKHCKVYDYEKLRLRSLLIDEYHVYENQLRG